MELITNIVKILCKPNKKTSLVKVALRYHQNQNDGYMKTPTGKSLRREIFYWNGVSARFYHWTVITSAPTIFTNEPGPLIHYRFYVISSPK